jgi:hypothetical protein
MITTENKYSALQDTIYSARREFLRAGAAHGDVVHSNRLLLQRDVVGKVQEYFPPQLACHTEKLRTGLEGIAHDPLTIAVVGEVLLQKILGSEKLVNPEAIGVIREYLTRNYHAHGISIERGSLFLQETRYHARRSSLSERRTTPLPANRRSATETLEQALARQNQNYKMN